jgi:hypothetical protein
MVSLAVIHMPSGMKRPKYDAVCVKNEESFIASLNEELDIDSDDQMELENIEETASEISSDEISKIDSKSETSVLLISGWEDVTMCDKKPKAYTFTKNAGTQFNLLPDAEPMDHFSLFFNDDLLNDTVLGTNRFARHNISEFQVSPRYIWFSWYDVSVSEMKALPLLDIKYYWSSEWKTQIQFFGDLLSRFPFL